VIDFFLLFLEIFYLLNEVAWGGGVVPIESGEATWLVCIQPLKLFLRIGSISNTLLALKLLIAVVDKFSSAEM
jgi:hypothetical protein